MTAEVLDKFSTLITTALASSPPSPGTPPSRTSSIQSNALFGKAGGALAGQFLYAILITLVVIFATIYVGRAAERAKKAEEERIGLFGRSRE